MAETEKDHRIRQLERTLGGKSLEIAILKHRGGMSCGGAHSKAREMLMQGYTGTLVAASLAISRSSLYYRKRTAEEESQKSMLILLKKWDR